MGYRIVADQQQMDSMREKYGPRKGLEGPFNFGGRVLYYDNQQGQYYDPTTDFYVEQDEMNMIHSQLLERLAK
jgi:hypothetical protein